jgi:hypothetical protein
MRRVLLGLDEALEGRAVHLVVNPNVPATHDLRLECFDDRIQGIACLPDSHLHHT